MAEIGNHAGNEPWPALDWATWLFDRASFVLIGSLIAGAAATVAIVWMGIVKEHHWDLLRERSNETVAALQVEAAKANAARAKSDERIAELNKETAKLAAEADTAREAIASANERAAKADQRAAEAQLALEKFKAPRFLTASALARVKAAAAKFPGTPFDISVNMESEPQNFAGQVGAMLVEAGWVWKPRSTTAGLSFNVAGHSVGMMSFTGGLGIEIDIAKKAEWEPVVLALGNALLTEGVQLVMNMAKDHSASPDAVHLYFGTKR